MGLTISAINRDGLTNQGKVFVQELFHHGVKGMHWGIRRTDAQLSRASGSTTVQEHDGKVTYVTAKGHPVSADAYKARANQHVAKTHGSSALSNEDLNHLVNRMQLEQRYSSLKPKSKLDKGKDFVRQAVKTEASAIAKGKQGPISKTAGELGKLLSDKNAKHRK